MRRLLCLLLAAFLLAAALAEPPAPIADPEGVAESALPLMTLLCACPSFQSFRGAPGEALWREAIDDLPFFFAGEIPENAAWLLFAEGEAPAPVPPSTAPYIPTRLSLESAFDTGAGSVLASVRVEQAWDGEEYEFSFYAEFTLRPDPDALFRARVERAFIPE